jgi:hypothetical protein
MIKYGFRKRPKTSRLRRVGPAPSTERVPSEPPVSSERLAEPSETAPISDVESDEEDRFFSAPPPDFSDQTSPSQYAPEPSAAPEAPTPRVSTPEQHAHRARLRRLVVGAVCSSVALLLVGTLMRHRAAPVSPELRAQSEATALRPVPMLAAAQPAVHAAPALDLPAPIATPTASAESAAAEPAASGDRGDDPAILVRTARVLLESGHVREGVATARSAVEADPVDAEPYILLAAGLQDLGNWSEARAVFRACQKKTRHGASCGYFANR